MNQRNNVKKSFYKVFIKHEQVCRNQKSIYRKLMFIINKLIFKKKLPKQETIPPYKEFPQFGRLRGGGSHLYKSTYLSIIVKIQRLSFKRNASLL